MNNEKVTPAGLIALLESKQDQINILSLDCFDTLLWRKTATPIDVFYNLSNKPAFKALGYTHTMRIQSESSARRIQLLQHGKTEVQLHDIYRHHFPDLTTDELNKLAQDEVNAEIESCYCFPPVADLIRKAHDLKKKIIIVSDTYLNHSQLQSLLKNTLPDDVFSKIDTIFCSNEYGYSKRNGLFKDVLKKMKEAPERILHIGDSHVADFLSARNNRIQASHLEAINENITHLLRMQTSAASLMDSSIRSERAMTSPFHAVFATANLDYTKPEQFIGYAAVGPILYSFAKFLIQAFEDLKKENKNTKMVFLMRDAYLPSLVCEAIAKKEIGKRVRISRFASIAASFRSRDDITRYLSDVLSSNRLKDIAKQLLMPEKMATDILNRCAITDDPTFKFVQCLQEKSVEDFIFSESKKYFSRLKKHLEKEVDLKPGDTLVFVDLGYSGTAQRKLESIFKNEMNVTVIGRYLIALPIPGWEKSRSGLLDAHYCDERLMLTLVNYIALLEQMCTSNEKSVIDYDEKGNSIFSTASLSKQQYDKLDLIQEQCLRFARDAENLFTQSGTTLSPILLKDAAMTSLTRFIYLPTDVEIRYLENFQFNLDLGTTDVFKIFDREEGLTSLRRRGIFSLFMEKNAKTFRTNSPAELRSAGMELALSLMTQHRYTLEFGLNDLSLRREPVNVIILNGKESLQEEIEARVTHDGYFSLLVPVGNGNLKVGILFGQKYQFVQLESVELIRAEALLSSAETQCTEDAWSHLLFSEIIEHGQKLLECKSKASVLVVNTPRKRDGFNYVVRVIFRPIVAQA